MNYNQQEQISKNLEKISPAEIVEVFLGAEHPEHKLIFGSFKNQGYQGFPTWFIVYSFPNYERNYLLMICGFPGFSKFFNVLNCDNFLEDLEKTSSKDILALLLTSRELREGKFDIEQGYRICNYLLEATKSPYN